MPRVRQQCFYAFQLCVEGLLQALKCISLSEADPSYIVTGICTGENQFRSFQSKGSEKHSGTDIPSENSKIRRTLTDPQKNWGFWIQHYLSTFHLWGKEKVVKTHDRYPNSQGNAVHKVHPSFTGSFSAQDVSKWVFPKDKSSFLSTCSEVAKTNPHISSAQPLKICLPQTTLLY